MNLLESVAETFGRVKAAYDAPLLRKAYELRVDGLGRTLPMQFTGSTAAQWLTGEGGKWAGQMRGQVWRVSNAYATAAAGVQFALYKPGQNGKPERIADHDLLRLLYKPNAMQGQFAFWYQAWTEYRDQGNCFITTVKPEMGPRRGGITELWILPLLNVQPMGGSATEPVEFYRYTPDLSKPGTFYDLPRTECLHLKQYAPDNARFGLGCIAAAAREATADVASITAQVSLLQNQGPAGVLWFEPGQDGNAPELGSGVVSDFRNRLNRMNRGVEAAGQFPISTQKVGWTSLGTTAVDLDILAFRRANFADLCGFWGLPSILLGDKEGTTFNNLGEARKMMFTMGILPFFGSICQDLTEWLCPQFGIPTAWLQADVDAIPEMQADKLALATWLEKCDFIPVVTKQEMMGVTPDWDGPKYLVRAGFVGSDTLTALPPADVQ